MKNPFRFLKKGPKNAQAAPANPVGQPPVSRGEDVPPALSVAKSALTLTKTSTTVFPPLQSAAGGLLFLVNQSIIRLKNKAEVTRIIERLNDIEQSMKAGGPRPNDNLTSRLTTCGNTLQELISKSTYKGYLFAQDDAAQLHGIIGDIGNIVMEYLVFVAQAQFEKASSMMDSDDTRVLQTLPRAPDAHHLAGNHEMCLSGTRVDLLLKLDSWAHDTSSLSMFWLNGHAGSGKSTIAQSFCRQVYADQILGASFFCSRDTEARSNLHMIFPTLSFQLAFRFPEFRACILKTLKNHPDIGRESLDSQLTSLLIEPLETTSLSTIIVIDALDECKDNEPESAILSLLATRIQRIPKVKWFITGRPEPRIRMGFRNAGLQSITETLILHDVTPTSIDHDISLFLKTRLENGVKRRSDLHLPSAWPSEADIQALTVKCGQLFIFAHTAVKYILSANDLPANRLAEICASEVSTSNQGRLGLDQLYTVVLEEGYGGASSSHHEDLRMVIASIVLAFNPLTLQQISDLVPRISAPKIHSLLRSLHAVIRVPKEPHHPIVLYHKSFFDFITDGSRCTNSAFHIEPSSYHCLLAESCLRLMNSHLRRNICSLPRYAMNAQMDLMRRRECVGATLEYACFFWAPHLSASAISADILKVLGTFLERYQIRWMEVLSLVDNFQSVIVSLHDVYDALTAAMTALSGSEEEIKVLLHWIYDGRKFAAEFREIAQVSASHLYHTALPLSPRDSPLFTSHAYDLASEIKILHGYLDHGWPSSEISFSPGTRGSRMKFSNNGKMLAFPRNGSVIVDVISGKELFTLPRCSICFSPDDSLIAMATGPLTATIFDIQTGAQSIINPSPSDDIYVQPSNQAFSPSGQYIAMGTYGRIEVWDVLSGECRWHKDGVHPKQLVWLQEDPPQLVVKDSERDGICIVDVSYYGDPILVYSQQANPFGCNLDYAISTKYGLIAVVHGYHLLIMDLKTQVLLSQTPPPPDAVARASHFPPSFSSLEPLMFCNGYLYDISDPRTPQMLPTMTGITFATFSPTHPIFAADYKGTIQLWPIRHPSFTSPSTVPQIKLVRREELQRQLKVSQDGRGVLLITDRPDATIITLDDRGIAETRIIPIPDQIGISQSLPPGMLEETSQNIEPGLDFMNALNMYWRPRLKSHPGEIGVLRFISPACKTFAYVEFSKHSVASLKVRIYSLEQRLQVAQKEWKIDLSRNQEIKFWVDMDMVRGVLTIYNHSGVSGEWKVVNGPEGVEGDSSEGTHNYRPVAPEELVALEEGLMKRHTTESIEYPVLLEELTDVDNGWVVNQRGQRIFWVPHATRAGPAFKQKWRWARRRLIVASDGLGQRDRKEPLIADFSGVDAVIPTARDVMEEWGWNRLVISGLDRLED